MKLTLRRQSLKLCMRGLVQFLAQHVQMPDVRLYIRDALRKYASLQRFMPHPSWNAECYTGEMLLEQFGFPHAFDAEAVAQVGGSLCSGVYQTPIYTCSYILGCNPETWCICLKPYNTVP